MSNFISFISYLVEKVIFHVKRSLTISHFSHIQYLHPDFYSHSFKNSHYLLIFALELQIKDGMTWQCSNLCGMVKAWLNVDFSCWPRDFIVRSAHAGGSYWSSFVLCIRMSHQRCWEKRLMAHCACFLGMSNVKKTLRQTQYVVEECHFPILVQGGVQ